jgi:hypothetical protein
MHLERRLEQERDTHGVHSRHSRERARPDQGRRGGPPAVFSIVGVATSWDGQRRAATVLERLTRIVFIALGLNLLRTKSHPG